MSQTLPPLCRHCQAILAPPGLTCDSCGRGQEIVPFSQTAVQAPNKSLGVALLLTFLWMGAGHLYVGKRIPLGLGIMAAAFVLFLIDLTIIGMVVSIPLSIALFIYAVFSVNQDVTAVSAA